MFTRNPAVAALLACVVVVATAGAAVAQQPAEKAAGLDMTQLRQNLTAGSDFMERLARELDAPPQQEGPQVVQEPQGPTLELSLLEAIELAVRHNLQAQVQRYSLDNSFEGIKAARAVFDPRLQFSAPSQFRRSTSRSTSQIDGADVITNESFGVGASFSETLEWGTGWSVNWSANRSVSNSTFSSLNPSLGSNLNFSVQQPLLNGFGRVNRIGIEVAMNGYDQSREGFRGQLQNIIFQVYQAYWQLVGQIENVQNQQEAVDLAEQQLRRNEIQIEIGTLAPIDAVQARQTAESARLGLIQAQNQLLNAQDNLKQLLNVEEVDPAGWDLTIVPTDEPETTMEPTDLDEALAMALENDPGLRQQRIGVQNARLNLVAARNNLLPQVNATASLALSGTSGDRIIRGALGGGISEVQQGGFTDALSQLFSGDFNTWSVGLSISMPLHNWSAEASHARASISERQTLTSLELAEQQVVVAVRQAVRNVENGARSVATAQSATDLARQQLNAEQRKFEVGTSTNFNVLQFQRQLSVAQQQELNAVISFNIAQAQLEVVKGTLLESLGVTIQEAGRGPVRR